MKPMLALPFPGGDLDEFLTAKEHVYELKLDGVRIVADTQARTLTYRSGRDASSAYPEVVEAMAASPVPLVLDGEVVAFDDAGRPSFQRLGERIHAQHTHTQVSARKSRPVVFAVFDVLRIDGQDTQSLPLSTRKMLLDKALATLASPHLRVHPTFPDGRPLYAFCKEHGLEGVIRKRLSSPYRPGPHRTPDWIKLKLEDEGDFVIVGYTAGEGSRQRLGAIEVASYQEGELVLRGRVGSGFSEETIDTLLALFEGRTAEKCAARGTLSSAKGRVFLRPELVVSVRHMGTSEEGTLRFPVYRGVRTDMAPDDLQHDGEGIASVDEKATAKDAVPRRHD